jgi:CobQ-like glutamine amidotransferase family enzyme
MQSREVGDCGDCMAVYDDAGNVIETRERAGYFKEP